MIQLTHKEQCCGCTACASICTRQAISMERDVYGFAYPKTHPDRCVECGLCEKVCPLQNPKLSTHTSQLSPLVALARDHAEQRSSASGGMASLFARHVIRHWQGIVYGCSARAPHHVRHVRVESEDGLQALKGSKYVQSDLDNILPLLKKDVHAGRAVLFVGTPCQCAAVRRFMLKDYENLFLIDFICHGVPSQRMLSEAVRHRCPEAGSVQFRYRDRLGRLQYGLSLTDPSGHLRYRRRYGYDRYATAFLKGMDYRPSCHSCPFASTARPGDLTVGDFWDHKKAYTHLSGHKDGLSQLHINTPRGQCLVDACRQQMLTSPIALGELLDHSLQLSRPMPRHPQSQAFYEAFAHMPFDEACNAALPGFFARYWLYELKSTLRRLLSRLFFQKNT